MQGGDGQIYMDPQTAKVLDQAQQVAQKAGDSYVTVERLLTALALVKSPRKTRSRPAPSPRRS